MFFYLALVQDGTSLVLKEPVSLLESVCPDVLASRMHSVHGSSTSGLANELCQSTKTVDTSIKHEPAGDASSHLGENMFVF